MKKTDDIVVAICNFLISTFCSKEYQRLFKIMTDLGGKEMNRIKAERGTSW